MDAKLSLINKNVVPAKKIKITKRLKNTNLGDFFFGALVR
jgi:hypothetical protein